MTDKSEKLLALSIRQPWLDMILRGVKSMEIRSWNVRFRGVIALHSPRAIDFSTAYFYGYKEPWKLPRGKIVALAEIDDVQVLNEISWREAVESHRQPMPMIGGAYGVRLKNIRVLDKPVPCRGQQLLFPLDNQMANHILRGVSRPLQDNNLLG